MKIEDNRAVIETVEEAVCFDHITHMFLYDLLNDWENGIFRPSRHQVSRAMKPKKGRQVRAFNPNLPGDEHPYLCTYDGFVDLQEQFPEIIGVDDNAITTGTCGEIRKVLEWAKSEDPGS